MRITFIREWSGHEVGTSADLSNPTACSLITHGYAVAGDAAPTDPPADPAPEPPAQTDPTASPDAGATQEEV